MTQLADCRESEADQPGPTDVKKAALALAVMSLPIHAGTHDLVAVWERLLPTGRILYSADFSEVAADYQRGVPFWIPCAGSAAGPGRLVAKRAFANNLGYGPAMAFACAQPAGALPLYRYSAKSTPFNPIYTTSLPEASFLAWSGHVFERVEGYVFATQVPGTFPLYRMLGFNAGTGVFEHRLTLRGDARDTLIADGWIADGVLGYAFDGYSNASVTTRYQGTFNGRVTAGDSPGSWSSIGIQDVSPPSGYLVLRGQGGGTAEGKLGSNSTTRPTNARKQRITFDLHTGSLFEEGSNIDHIPVFLYSHIQYSSSGLGGVPYDGMGIFFAKPDWGGNRCRSANSLTTGGQIFVERMGSGSTTCEANLAETGGVAPLRPHQRYEVTFTVGDDAVVALEVRNPASEGSGILPFATPGSLPKSFAADFACPISPALGSLTSATIFCGNPYTPLRFPVHRTGYALWPIFSATTPADKAGVGGISSIVVQWLDANDNVVWTQ